MNPKLTALSMFSLAAFPHALKVRGDSSSLFWRNHYGDCPYARKHKGRCGTTKGTLAERKVRRERRRGSR